MGVGSFGEIFAMTTEHSLIFFGETFMNKRISILAIAIIAFAGSGSAIADVESGQGYF